MGGRPGVSLMCIFLARYIIRSRNACVMADGSPGFG